MGTRANAFDSGDQIGFIGLRRYGLNLQACRFQGAAEKGRASPGIARRIGGVKASKILQKSAGPRAIGIEPGAQLLMGWCRHGSDSLLMQ